MLHLSHNQPQYTAWYHSCDHCTALYCVVSNWSRCPLIIRTDSSISPQVYEAILGWCHSFLRLADITVCGLVVCSTCDACWYTCTGHQCIYDKDCHHVWCVTSCVPSHVDMVDMFTCISSELSCKTVGGRQPLNIMSRILQKSFLHTKQIKLKQCIHDI